MLLWWYPGAWWAGAEGWLHAVCAAHLRCGLARDMGTTYLFRAAAGVIGPLGSAAPTFAADDAPFLSVAGLTTTRAGRTTDPAGGQAWCVRWSLVVLFGGCLAWL
jgi:hypothetical protein